MAIEGVGPSGKFYWWEGVVEDNLDPNGAGRCGVRVIAHNSPLKDDLDTVQLSWAYPLMPLNNPHGKIVALKPGTRVMGHYRDGPDGQDLVMLGTINTGYENPGYYDNYNDEMDPENLINISKQPDRIGELGFSDDREGTGGPIPGQPQKSYVSLDEDGNFKQKNISDYGPLLPNEINTPRLARGIARGTITEAHIKRQRGRYDSIKTPAGTIMYEPNAPFEALYPFNTVEESDSGHFREMDDTPDHERIKESHRTGTFYEIHPDGTKVTKVIKDDFSVTIGDKGVKVDGVCAVHVVGQADFYCESDINVKTDKNATIDVKETATINADQDIVVTANSSVAVYGREDVQVTSDGPLDLVAMDELNLYASGVITFEDETAVAANVDDVVRDLLSRRKRAKASRKLSKSSKAYEKSLVTDETIDDEGNPVPLDDEGNPVP